MKYFILIFSLLAPLFAIDGQKIFEYNCKGCHNPTISKKEALANFDKLPAPPMLDMINRIKDDITVKSRDKEQHRSVVVAFIQEYVKRPDLMKSFCSPVALDQFGVMPPLTHLKEKELHTVAEWLYDTSEGKKFE
jgi:hydrogenase maturation factor HypF (carbamoyltransferase family)